MVVHPEERQAVLDHLVTADFELRVAGGFKCLEGTPAHDNLKSAIQQTQCALAWVKGINMKQESAVMKLPPMGEGLPLTRKQRVGYRWP